MGRSLVDSERSVSVKRRVYLPDVDEFRSSSGPLSEVVLESLERVCSSRAKPVKEGYVADFTREGGVSPSCVILGLLYIHRLSETNPRYLRTMSGKDIFLTAMVIASKYLNDEGESEALTNSEWAEVGCKLKPTLDLMEREFLAAIDWRLYVSLEDYYSFVTGIEGRIALNQFAARGWLTYTDLVTIWDAMDTQRALLTATKQVAKVTCGSAAVYLVLLSTLFTASHTLHSWSPSSSSSSSSSPPSTITTNTTGTSGTEVPMMMEDPAHLHHLPPDLSLETYSRSLLPLLTNQHSLHCNKHFTEHDGSNIPHSLRVGDPPSTPTVLVDWLFPSLPSLNGAAPLPSLLSRPPSLPSLSPEAPSLSSLPSLSPEAAHLPSLSSEAPHLPSLSPEAPSLSSLPSLSSEAPHLPSLSFEAPHLPSLPPEAPHLPSLSFEAASRVINLEEEEAPTRGSASANLVLTRSSTRGALKGRPHEARAGLSRLEKRVSVNGEGQWNYLAENCEVDSGRSGLLGCRSDTMATSTGGDRVNNRLLGMYCDRSLTGLRGSLIHPGPCYPEPHTNTCKHSGPNKWPMYHVPTKSLLSDLHHYLREIHEWVTSTISELLSLDVTALLDSAREQNLTLSSTTHCLLHLPPITLDPPPPSDDVLQGMRTQQGGEDWAREREGLSDTIRLWL